MEIAEKIKIIAEHYGYESQSRQCIEEMAELTQVINKFWRACGNGQATEKDVGECLENIQEEMADVQIMLLQMIRFLGNGSGRKVFEIMEQKLDRQLKRIEEEQ